MGVRVRGRVAKVVAQLKDERGGELVILVTGTDGRGATWEYLMEMVLDAGKKIKWTT